MNEIIFEVVKIFVMVAVLVITRYLHEIYMSFA